MSWNYRIIKNKDCYQISEVYYDSKGNINGYGDAPIPYGESKEEVKECLDLMYESLNKSILNIEDLEKRE